MPAAHCLPLRSLYALPMQSAWAHTADRLRLSYALLLVYSSTMNGRCYGADRFTLNVQNENSAEENRGLV